MKDYKKAAYKPKGVLCATTLSDALMLRVARYRERNGVNRSEALRQLITRGLNCTE
jgi:hypothetical protein